MRTPIVVSVYAFVLIGCGDDATTGVTEDASTSDGGGFETGSAADGGAPLRDATATPDATVATDGAALDGPATDGAASGDAATDADASADAVVGVDAIANIDAGAMDGADGGDAATCARVDDPVNCGRCGHSCGGGACNAGICQPFVVAALPPALTQAYDISANDSFAYVSGSSSDQDASVIYSAPLDGGALQIFALAADPPFQLIADPSTLYWAGFQSISSSSLTGGGVTTIAAHDTASIAGFGADPRGAVLYWGEVSNTNNLTVWMDAVDGGAPTVIWDGGDQPCAGVEFAATDRDVYWTYNSNNSGSNVPVLTAPLGSTAITTVASVPYVEWLAAQGDNLFALSFATSQGVVESIPLDAGTPVFYADDAGAGYFAVDPNWLYVLDQANTLRAYPLDGGGSLVLDEDVMLASYRFATAPGFIYWVSAGPPMTVMGVATP